MRGGCIRRLLVTKYADIEVSGHTYMFDQTQIKQLIQRYKPQRKRGTHARAEHVCLSKRTKHRPSNTRCLIECLVAFKFYQNGQAQSNTIKQHQAKWPNGKMFDHQTMFDGVCQHEPRRQHNVTKRIPFSFVVYGI